MSFIQRFKSGLYYGLNSFGLVWKHPRLLVYLGAPIMLGIAIELIVYNLYFFSDASTAFFIEGIMLRIWATFGWTGHFGIFLTDTIRLFVTIFAAVALIDHTDYIMRGEHTTIAQVIKKTAPRWKQIFVWSLIATIFFVLIHPIDQIISTSVCASCFRLAFFVSAIARIAWSLLTAFVVVCIALEQLPLRRIMVLAPTITKKMFFEYFGAVCWIGLICILGITPFVLFRFNSQIGQTVGYTILTLGSCILSTVYVILQVTLYRVYKNSSLWEKIITFPPL
jgi:hypothetical protein